jgi:glycosyltransferase involved in cell wall biosynthesis
MKVLNVVDGSGWTGGVEQALLLAAELRRRGADARLAAHRDNPILGEAKRRGVPAYPYEGDGGGVRNIMSLHRLLGEKYDFVIGHKPGAIRQLILPIGLRHRRSRFVGVRRVSFPVSSLTVYRAPERVVAVSASVKKVLSGSGLKGGKIVVIPSGVDTDLFQPLAAVREKERRERGLEGKVVILNLAKFVPEQKGQRHLLEAVAVLKGRYPLKVLLAGIDTDGERARDTVRGFGLEDVVDLLGFRRDIVELIQVADLFVFPSLPGLDAIAGSVLQAMACGKIVVASAVGGIPEYLHDGRNGFLVPPGERSALAAAMERAIALPPGERAAMAGQARETVVSGYSVSAMGESYLRLFAEMEGAASGGKKRAPP